MFSTNSGAGPGAEFTLLPASGNPGASFSVTATLSASAMPPPQSGVPVSSFTVGALNVTGANYTYNGAIGGGTVTGTLFIPSGTAAGSQTATITFAPPPNQTQGLSLTQSAAFAIN